MASERSDSTLRLTTLFSEQASDETAEQAPTLYRMPRSRQAQKISEIKLALVAAGYRRLDEQAAALGLSRSTTWTIVKSNHKTSGLSVPVIKRILAAPRLPATVRTVVDEYVNERAAGLYGGSKSRVTRFVARMRLPQR